MLEARTIELRWDVCLVQQMTLMAKVKVTMTSSKKQAYNLAMIGASTLKDSRDVSYDQKMTLRAKVVVKVTMIFRITSLLAMLYIT